MRTKKLTCHVNGEMPRKLHLTIEILTNPDLKDMHGPWLISFTAKSGLISILSQFRLSNSSLTPLSWGLNKAALWTSCASLTFATRVENLPGRIIISLMRLNLPEVNIEHWLIISIKNYDLDNGHLDSHSLNLSFGSDENENQHWNKASARE